MRAQQLQEQTGKENAATSSVTIGETEFWNELMHGVYGPRKGGAKILIDAENAALGVGKTTAAVALARLLATAFDYDLKEDDFVLSANEYMDRYRAHPGKEQPSVIVLDEMVGAGAGDKMRTMAKKNVNLVRAWQLQRVKRVVTITTLASWADAVKGLRKLADYRLLCQQKPIGCFRPYKLGTFDFDEGSKIRFERLDDRIYFPKMDDDPYYEHVSELKDELIDSERYDADDLLEEEDEEDPEDVRKEMQIAAAQALRNNGMEAGDVLDELDLDYSRSWVYKHTDSPVQSEGGKPQEGSA